MGNTDIQKKDSDNKIINEEKPKNIKPINLIETVKSKYVIKELFSYLSQILKLRIIKYNKKYQNLFEINIENYKKESKIVRIMENDGFGKEYTIDENKLIFEGEFKNGKKNGKGKEYDKENGEILFKGIYLKGKRHGKGIKYYSGGGIEFEGEYSNGYKIEGKGYNYGGKLNFVLERNGKGKEYAYGKLSFEGEFLNEMRNGNGKEYYKNGKLSYKGEYKNNLLNGKVKQYDEKGKWKGRANEEYFQGEYLNGKRWNGKAIEYKFKDPDDILSEEFEELNVEYINGKSIRKGERYNNDNDNDEDANAEDNNDYDGPI